MAIFLKEKRRANSSPERISKYLRYAIGEVILLVIGILIALQINTWNDMRKDREKELFYLKRLRTSIENSQMELNRVFNDAKEGAMASDSLIELIAIEQIPEAMTFDSLLNLSSDYSIYSADHGAIKEIISSGNLSLIRNEQLRNQIASWDARIHNIAKFEQETKEFRQNFIYFLGDYRDLTIVYRDSTRSWLIEESINKLTQDQRFRYHLASMLINHSVLSNIYGSELSNLEAMLGNIEKGMRNVKSESIQQQVARQ